MFSKTYLLKVQDLRVLAVLKEMIDKGQIELKDYWPEITETAEHTADAY